MQLFVATGLLTILLIDCFLPVVLAWSTFANNKFQVRQNILLSSYRNKGTKTRVLFSQSDSSSDSAALRDEAEDLLERARKIRESLPEEKEKEVIISDSTEEDKENVLGEYRLYVDIGRESGTWMEPRWAASGKRIDFSLDVALYSDLVPKELADQMVNDNTWGEKTPVYRVRPLQPARLRSGFDKMKCQEGGYRLDNKSTTIRFFLPVDGIGSAAYDVAKSTYGDVWIPSGNLYFSLPCFGSPKNLSTREGPVTVREMGWHTGWRRKESRIVGTFRAVRLANAQKKDKY
jgi:hypothetical protein